MWPSLRADEAERHVNRERLTCAAAVVNVFVTATRRYGNGSAGPQRSGTARACTVAPTVPQMGSTVIEQSCGAPQMVYNSAGVAGACCAAGAAGSNVHRKREWRAAASIGEK